jgi:uncharacterized protein (DUF2384 family)
MLNARVLRVSKIPRYRPQCRARRPTLHVEVSAMRREERQSLARVKRVARLAQRTIDVLGGTAEAYYWLTKPCAALRGKAPRDIHYDVEGAGRVATALRQRTGRQRLVRKAAKSAFLDETALTTWLWKKSRALGNRPPAMLLDSDRGASQVVSVISRMRKRDTNANRCIGISESDQHDARAIAIMYGLSTPQVARMLGFAPTDLRRKSTLLKIRYGLQRLTSLLENIRRMLGGDPDAVKVWLNAPHPALGLATPMKYLIDGHFDQVESLVDAYLSGQSD